MSTKNLHKRLKKIEEQQHANGINPAYLPHIPRTLAGAARAILEFHSEHEIKYEGAQASFENVKEATDDELLILLGFTPDVEGLGKFFLVKQHWIALICHNLKVPHNCGEYCPGYEFGPYVPKAPVFRPEYERLAARHNYHLSEESTPDRTQEEAHCKLLQENARLCPTFPFSISILTGCCWRHVDRLDQ